MVGSDGECLLCSSGVRSHAPKIHSVGLVGLYVVEGRGGGQCATLTVGNYSNLRAQSG